MFIEISQNSQESTCARVSFLLNLQAEACNFIKKETLAQVFSCEFWEISKNNFFTTEHLWAIASVSDMYCKRLRIFHKTFFSRGVIKELFKHLWGSYVSKRQKESKIRVFSHFIVFFSFLNPWHKEWSNRENSE